MGGGGVRIGVLGDRFRFTGGVLRCRNRQSAYMRKIGDMSKEEYMVEGIG